MDKAIWEIEANLIWVNIILPLKAKVIIRVEANLIWETTIRPNRPKMTGVTASRRTEGNL